MAKALLNEVADYYSAKLAQHGETAEGVDWNGEESQLLRFTQLCKVIAGEPFSITDLGCGYGALLDHLNDRYARFTYFGNDIAPAMIEAAKKRYLQPNAQFTTSAEPHRADYCVASGIFNVRQQRSDAEWWGYITSTLDTMASASNKGFAANFLPSYADADKKRDYLYYADPLQLSDYCTRHGTVTLLRDYGIYEFTLMVRKS